MLKWFRWIHPIVIAFVLLQPTVPAIVLGRYSAASMGLLVVLLVTYPIIWNTKWILERLVKRLASWPSDRYWLVWTAGCMLSFVIWVIPISNADSMTIVKLYLTFIIVALIMPGASTQGIRRIDRWLNWLGPILTAFSAIFGLFVTVRFANLFWVDEGSMTAIAVSADTHHTFIPAMFYGGVPYGPIYSLFYQGIGFWYRVFAVSVSSGHAFVFVVSMVVLFFLYQTIQLSYGRLSAWTAIIVTIFPMILSSTIRNFSWTSLYIGIAFWSFAYAQRSKRQWLHLIVGFATGFSLDGHPNAYRFLPAFFLAYAIEYLLEARAKNKLFIDRRLIYLTLGGLVGVVAYVGLYSVIAPDGFLAQAKSAGFFANWAQTPVMLWDQLEVAIRNAPLLFGLALIGLCLALRQPSPFDRLVILVGVFNAIIFAVSNPTGIFRDYYFHQVWLVWGILAARAVKDLAETHKWTWAMVTIVLLVASVGWLIRSDNGSDSYNGAIRVADQIRLILPADTRVVAPDPFYLRMSDYPNFIEINAGDIAGAYHHIDPLTIWQQLAPDAVVVVTNYPIRLPDGLLAYIKQQHFQNVRCWNNPGIGEVDLYLRSIPIGFETNITCKIVL